MLTHPTWEKYTVMSSTVKQMSVRDRRHIFVESRKVDDISPDVLFPHFGLTFGEFSLWYLVGNFPETNEKKRRVP